MNDMVKIAIPSLAMTEAELISVLQNSLYPGVELESIKLVLGWCKASNKDPMKRPVHIVPMQVKQKVRGANGALTNKTEYVWRDVIMPGIGDYRTDAARTGEYAGISEARFGPDLERDFGGGPILEWSEQARAKVSTGRNYPAVKFKFPEWCELSVYRLVGGTRCEFSSGRVYFEETYAAQSKENEAPNAMWKKRPRGQLEKCAEAMALRRAFPEVGAQPTADELAGKTLDEGVTIDNETGAVQKQPQVAGPQSKSAAAAEPVATTTVTAHTNGNGNGTDKPITPGVVRIIKSKIKGYAAIKGISEEEATKQALEHVQVATVEALVGTQANQLTDWMTEQTGC